MCGIVGWVDWDVDVSQQPGVIDRMSATLRRRGPDADGRWLTRHAALGHRRLSIIDPTNGQQPMIHEENGKRVVLVFNGEIYNYRELRDVLEGRGHSFRTRSDTEVLLRAYVEWGEDCLAKLNGIYAFAIWDDTQERVFLARDPLGVKPLFWTRRKTGIVFGSELKAVLAHPEVDAEVDADGLAELVVAPPRFTGGPSSTPFRGIHELRAGRCITFDRSGIRERVHWRLSSAPHIGDVETTAQRVHEILAAAVERQLVADVPLGCLLSGGLDSSGIAALAVPGLRRAGLPLLTWTVEHVDSEETFAPSAMAPSRDAPFALEVAEHLGAQHKTIVLDTDMMLDNLLDAMRARDLPIATQLDTSLLLLLRAVKEDATVVLSGEAADEVFGGYPWFTRVAAGGVHPTSFPWAPPHDPWPGCFTADVLARVEPEACLRRRYEEARAEVPALEGESETDAIVRETFYLTLTRWLAYLLDRKDRISMAASVEARVPFCDQDLVQFVWNVPHALKRADGMEKGLLRRALQGTLPASVLTRTKSAFPAFDHPMYLRGISARARELAAGGSPALQLYDAAKVEALCAADRPSRWSDPASAMFYLERFLQTDAWLREYHVALR